MPFLCYLFYQFLTNSCHQVFNCCIDKKRRYLQNCALYCLLVKSIHSFLRPSLLWAQNLYLYMKHWHILTECQTSSIIFIYDSDHCRFNPPRRQPDNREKEQQGGEEEACMAVLNNFYGDGIKWHDVACHHEKPIVCEDNEGHLAFARRTFPNIRIPWASSNSKWSEAAK